MSDTNLPTLASHGGDLALSDGATGDITAALVTFMANLNRRSEAFDDISCNLHVDRAADGGSRSVFSYRACKQRKG